MISNFFASNNSFGTPCGLLWALRQSFHNSRQKLAVSLSRKPVSWIWIFLMSGYKTVSWHIGQQEWYTYETLLFNKIVYHLNHNVVFVTQYIRYLTCYPSAQKFEVSFWECSIAEQGCILLDHLRPHFLHIHLLVKFWRKLSRPQDFCVHRSGHGC